MAMQADVRRAPDLTSTERATLQDLWGVYDAHYDEISEETERYLADDDEFGPLMKTMSPEMREQQSRHARELLRAAMVDGEWEAYYADLHEQGVTYARTGLSFVSWFRAVSIV